MHRGTSWTQTAPPPVEPPIPGTTLAGAGNGAPPAIYPKPLGRRETQAGHMRAGREGIWKNYKRGAREGLWGPRALVVLDGLEVPEFLKRGSEGSTQSVGLGGVDECLLSAQPPPGCLLSPDKALPPHPAAASSGPFEVGPKMKSLCHGLRSAGDAIGIAKRRNELTPRLRPSLDAERSHMIALRSQRTQT